MTEAKSAPSSTELLSKKVGYARAPVAWVGTQL